jgi:signal transduction histidine kinase
VRITDTGHGVPAAVVARVFDPFHTTKGRNGSGLGLSICQGLVRSHGGEVELRSEQGRGTCVTVRLPTLAGAARAAAVLHAAQPVHGDRAGTDA